MRCWMAGSPECQNCPQHEDCYKKIKEVDMSDVRKEVRITDEQARSTAKADYITGKNLSETLKEYAKDLLDARADNVILARKLLEMSAFLQSQNKIWDQIGANVKKILENQEKLAKRV